MLSYKDILSGMIFGILCSLPICTLNANPVEKYEKGLYFHSFEVDKDVRTSLNLTPGEAFTFKKGFDLSFDICLRREFHNFGYVFRIIANDNINIDLLSDISSDKYLFALVFGNKTVFQYQMEELQGVNPESWIPITFSFNVQTGRMSLSVNGIEKHADGDAAGLKTFDVFFGANNHKIFFTADVCPMTIRDVRLYNDKQKEIRHWELGKHGINEVYDTVVYGRALVENPTWIIDSHVRWQKRKAIHLPVSYPQIAYDDENGRVFVVKNNRIFIYHLETERVDTLKVLKGLPYNCEANQLVYDKNKGELISYSFETDTLSRFNFWKMEWSHNDENIVRPHFWHHGKQFLPDKNLLITVGGYGYHHYKKDLMSYSLPQQRWQKTDTASSLSPRYLGSLGYLGNGKLLYFGGFGNESGKQEEFPKNYYDLFLIDAQTKSVSKLWSLPEPEEHYTNSNSLVVDTAGGIFYALTYPNIHYNTYLRLSEFTIDSPSQHIVSDTIPYVFNDIESYCDLFLCARTSQLVAITSHAKNNSSEINIYTINYHPLSEADVLQKRQTKAVYGYLVLLLLLPAAFFYWRKRVQKEKQQQVFEAVGNSLGEINDENMQVEIQPSSINLLDNFHLIDHVGVDITSNFTPTTAQMFLLCLLSTIKNGKGISSQELKDILWYDKDDESARNNRNVNVSKLRVLLKALGNIEIVNNNNYWTITFGKEIFCDYKHVLSLIKRIEAEKNTRKDLLIELLNLASKGVLLSGMQLEWLDVYKAGYSDMIIEKFLRLSERNDVKDDLALVLKIVNVVLLHDNIEEDAIVKKCHALYYLGKKGQTKQCFEKFTDDYKNILGTDYKYTFDQFREKYL